MKPGICGVPTCGSMLLFVDASAPEGFGCSAGSNRFNAKMEFSTATFLSASLAATARTEIRRLPKWSTCKLFEEYI
jgi:hypothetical protein